MSAIFVAIVLALLTSSAPHASGSPLVAAYGFDEGAGTIVKDTSSQGNTGTTRDTAWSAAGRFGGALSFNGSSSWVSVPDSASLDLTKGFTIEAWVKPAADMGAAWRTIVAKEQTGDLVYGLYANSDTANPVSVSFPGAARTELRGTGALPPNVWTHVAATWDSQTLRLYVNGTQVSSRAMGGTLPISTGALRIGGNGIRGEWFNGQLDELRIYSQALSSGKVATDMTSPVTPVTPPPPPPPVDTTPPSAPTALAATTVATASITTSWAASTDNVGVTGYNLFRDGVSAGTTAAPGFTFAGLSCGTTYALGVEAVDATGNTSARSSISASTAPCPDTTAPSVPSAFAAGAIGTDSITASWTPSTDNVGVAGYGVFRDGVKVGTTTAGLFTFATLACGTTYVLGVEAFDSAGNTSARASLGASTAPCPDTAAPSVPSAFAAGATGTTSITASWAPSTDNVGVAGYSVFRDGVKVGTTTAGLFTFATLACGTSYVLGVEAFDAAGNTSARAPLAASTAPCPDTAAPSVPSAFAAGATGTTSITASWAPSTDNVGVAGYNVYRDGVQVGTTTGALFTFAGLTCGTGYALGVEAFDAAGNTSVRASLAASTAPCPDLTPPSAPAAFASSSSTVSSIATSWAPSTDNVGVAGYNVYRDGVKVGTTTAAPFTFVGLSCGTGYSLGVEAFDAAGNTSARSVLAAPTATCPDLTAPSAPAAFAASGATVNSIATSWSASTDNVGVAGYTVYRDGTNVGTISGASVATAPVVSFTFVGLSCATSYVLGVEAFDAAGNVSLRQSVTASSAACPDLTAPSAPAGLAASVATVSSIATTWAASTDNVGVAGYAVYRDGTKVTTTSTPGFTFVGLACGTSYVLGVEAFDAAGNVSSRSTLTAATAACPDVAAPSAPGSFVPGTAGTTSIATSWAASTDNVGVAGYTLYRDGVSVGTSTSALFTFSGLTCGTSYALAVEAFDAAGNVSARTAITAGTAACPDTAAPSTPGSFVSGTLTATSIATSWVASTDNVGVAGYRLYRGGVSAGTTTTSPFTFSGLTCGTSYALAVEAFDAAGNVSARPAITVSTPACVADTTRPSAPTGFVATTTGKTSLVMSWTASTDNVGVTGYNLYRSGVSQGKTTTTSFTYLNMTCGSAYSLAVEAFDAAGNLSPKTTVTALTTPCPDTVAPSAPTKLVATTVGTTAIALSWAASTDNVGVTSYSVFRDGTNVGTTPSTALTLSGLVCGTSYVLGVQASDAAGNASTRTSFTSATAACPETIPPSAPTGLTASSITATSITMSWTASTDNVGVTGYTVFLDGTSAGTTTTATTFTFAALSCATSHVLGVQAFDASGNVSARSAITTATAGCPDTVAPSAPAGLSTASSTQTTIATTWSPSTDNVGVAGYTLYVGASTVGTTTAPSFAFTGLACGTSYVLGVEAFDAAGNVSARSALTAATGACPDTAAPSAPASFGPGSVGATSIATSWVASTDNVGVAGYTLYRDGVSVGTSTSALFTFSGLTCGTSYVLGVEAFDAAGNVSARTAITAATATCFDTTPPTAPASFAAGAATSTSIPTSWAPSTDNVGVAGYTVYRDGASVGTISGASVATAPTVSFAFAGLSCGTSYVLGVEAFDAAGNVSLRQSLSASTTGCADTTAPQVAVTAPAPGASVSGALRLTATATDAAGIASVQFTVDGAAVGAPVASAPFALTWDTLAVPNGAHAIAARATDSAGNVGTSAAVTVTVQNAFDTTNAFKKVDVGPGFMDAALHGVIRTAAGRVYVFAADDTPQRKGTGPGVIHAYRADQLGIPTSFTEVDALHRPSATGTTHVVGSPDVRLAADGTAHMVYTDESNATLWYETFSTVTDTWGARTSLATGVDIPAVAIKRETSNALALDANDVPHVAYAGGGVVQYRNRVGGTWSAPVTISSGGTPIHVSLVAAPDGTVDLAWLQGALAPSTIRFAQRSAAGTWSAPETVAGSDVLDNSNADQGPSVVYSASNEPYVLYVNALPTSAVRVRHRAGGAWTLDPTPSDFFTHTPQIYMQGNDVYAFLGHDSQIRYAYATHIAGQPWSPLTALTTTADGTLDGSASTRFDPLHETNAGVIDTTFWDEDTLNNKTYFPEVFYMAVVPSGTGGGAPSSDTVAPTVSLTAPAGGATVSGVAAVSANAADNVGVVGVQFKLDGANLGAEDTAAPYSVNWDSATAANGSHTLTAVARDAGGNTATAAPVGVTTSNASAPPATTVLVGNAATEAKLDSNAAGQSEAFKTTAAATGSVTRLRLFVDTGSTAGGVAVGLYANNAGHPGTLLTSGTITASVAGQNNEVAVPAAAVTAGQTYWLAVLPTSGTLKFRDRAAVGAGSAENSAQATLTSLPATWSSGASFTDGLLSAVGLG